MSTAISPVREMRSDLERFAPRMTEVVGARGADEYVQRQIGLAMLAIKDNAALQRCSVESIATSLIRICGWRLEVGRTAYLMPFKGACTPTPAWQGLVELMLRAGHVRDVYAEVVYERDHFRLVQGTEKRLEHEPALVADRGAIVGAYAVARLKHGYSTFEWMTAADIETIRQRAPMPNSPLWTQHRVEAYKKTAVRRLAKRMPQSTAALDSALAVDESAGLADGFAAPALDAPSASMLRAAGTPPMYADHERPAARVGDRAIHPMTALPAGDPYAAQTAPAVEHRTSPAPSEAVEPTSQRTAGGGRVAEGRILPELAHLERGYAPDEVPDTFADGEELPLDVPPLRRRSAQAEGR